MRDRTLVCAVGLALLLPVAGWAVRKPHVVTLGAAKHVAYSRAGDPAGAQADEKELKIRALIVDGAMKEWTTGDAHDVTDRSFAVRRALRVNDTLPGDKLGHWVWQRGPWLLVDHVTGHAAPLKLPEYDPGASQVAWFRDYAAYCGVTPAGKSLYAVVWQVGARKPALSKKLGAYDAEHHPDPVCGPVEWQRQPLKASFHPTGREAVSFEVVPGSTLLVEDAGDEPETAPVAEKPASK